MTITVGPLYQVTTEITHGTITESVSGLSPGTNHTVSYMPDSGYYVSSVSVDGVMVSLDSYSSFYAFQNLQADHIVKVVCSPYYSVLTEVVNGMITPSDSLIKAGEHRTVSYLPNDEMYYLQSITVDGVVLSPALLASHFDSYLFADISSNHVVKVVYAKTPLITITKQIEGEVIWKKGSPEFQFVILGTDYLGVEHTYYRSLVFDASDGVSKSVSLQIPAGVWPVQELSLNDWSLSKIESGANCVVSDNTGVLDTRDSDTASVTFVNQLVDWTDYTENDTEVNVLK